MTNYYVSKVKDPEDYTDKGKPRSLWLTNDLVEIAKRLGRGSISAGVRVALRIAHDHKQTDQEK